MLNLDLRSITAMAGSMALLMGLIQLHLRAQYARPAKAAVYWGMAPLAGCGAAAFFALDGFVPSAWVVLGGNALTMLCALLFYFGSSQFFGAAVRWQPWGWAALTLLLCLSLFFFIVPDYKMRVFLICGFLLLVLLFHLEIFKKNNNGLASKLAMLIIVAHAAVIALRGMTVLQLNTQGAGRFSISTVQEIYVASFVFAIFFFSLCTFLLISERHRREFEHLATYDSLTGALTRFAVTHSAAMEFNRARRKGANLSLVLLDIDKFKDINDQHGHMVGDDVLRKFSNTIKDSLRSGDLLGRLGGDEFVIVLPETDAPTALKTAERIRQVVANSSRDGDRCCLTSSMGCTSMTPTDEDYASLLARADIALYRAKERGRNRVELI